MLGNKCTLHFLLRFLFRKVSLSKYLESFRREASIFSLVTRFNQNGKMKTHFSKSMEIILVVLELLHIEAEGQIFATFSACVLCFVNNNTWGNNNFINRNVQAALCLNKRRYSSEPQTAPRLQTSQDHSPATKYRISPLTGQDSNSQLCIRGPTMDTWNCPFATFSLREGWIVKLQNTPFSSKDSNIVIMPEITPACRHQTPSGIHEQRFLRIWERREGEAGTMLGSRIVPLSLQKQWLVKLAPCRPGWTPQSRT
jgi:hypothetical protein